MKKAAILVTVILLFSFSSVHADDGKATPQDVYNLVLKAYEVLNALGDSALPAFNDPHGEFVYKDTYVFVQRCPSEMMAHPFALDKLKGVDLNKFPFNAAMCKAASQPSGGWIAYDWPKPGESAPSRKVSFAIAVEGTPYSVVAGIYNDTESIEDLNKSLR